MSERPRIALLPWGDIATDFLDRLEVSLDDFELAFTGSWMFGYVRALDDAGVDTTIVCPTVAVVEPRVRRHRPTGATLAFLPVGARQGRLRKLALRERLDGRRNPLIVARAAIAHVAPYFETPRAELLRVLREESCAALLCQDYESPRFDVAVAVGERARIPVYGTFQGGDTQHSKLERFTRPRAIRRCAGLIIGPDEEAVRVRERYGVESAKIARLPNPVDTALWRAGDRARGRAALGIDQGALVVVWHGQLQRWRKGLDRLIAAWAAVEPADMASEPWLVLIGSGEDAALIEADIASAGLRNVLLLSSWVQNTTVLADYLAAGDVYVFPSRHEGQAVAPIEALASGLPIVGSDIRGVAEVVGPAGVVVPGDEPGPLAQALLGLLRDQPERERLRALAVARATSIFSLEAVGGALRTTLLAPVERAEGS